MIFAINGCSIDTDAYEVRRKGNIVPVEPQVFDLLVLLLKNSGRVVTKDEIISRVWHGRIVSEAALSSRIKAARQAIGDTGASQALIRTIRGRGFRVVGEVSQSAGMPVSSGAASDPAAPDKRAAGPAEDIAVISETVNRHDVKREAADPWWLNTPGTVVLASVLCALLLILGWRALARTDSQRWNGVWAGKITWANASAECWGNNIRIVVSDGAFQGNFGFNIVSGRLNASGRILGATPTEGGRWAAPDFGGNLENGTISSLKCGGTGHYSLQRQQ